MNIINFVFDITKINNLLNLQEEIAEAIFRIKEDSKIIFIATKCDQPHNNDWISVGINFIHKFQNAHLYPVPVEASAITGENLENLLNKTWKFCLFNLIIIAFRFWRLNWFEGWKLKEKLFNRKLVKYKWNFIIKGIKGRIKIIKIKK